MPLAFTLQSNTMFNTTYKSDPTRRILSWQESSAQRSALESYLTIPKYHCFLGQRYLRISLRSRRSRVQIPAARYTTLYRLSRPCSDHHASATCLGSVLAGGCLTVSKNSSSDGSRRGYTLPLDAYDAGGSGFPGDAAGYPTTPRNRRPSGSNRRLREHPLASTRVSAAQRLLEER